MNVNLYSQRPTRPEETPKNRLQDSTPNITLCLKTLPYIMYVGLHIC